MRTWQDKLAPQRGESGFKDYKQALDDHEAASEASRCIGCYEAPCISACPTGINIPQFISRIANGNVTGAARTILSSNVLGLSCAQSCPTEVLCEGACVYNTLDKKPITIGRLQRYAVETAYEKGARFFEAGQATGRRVALVGAGPASLACAHELRRRGHEAVIFEKADLPGGLNTYGIAPYKMKADVSLREIEEVAALGVQFQYGRELGRNLELAKLVAEYDAVFLGLGLGPDSRLDAPGADQPLVRGAVDFIAHLKTADARELAGLRHIPAALVVGGGNTALDACRELKGLGVPRVVVSYRRGEEEMSGYRHETKAARQEGVEFRFHTLPTAFEMLPGGGLRARLQETKVEGGTVKLTDRSTDLEVGLVLVATGQSKLEKLLAGVAGVTFEKGRLRVDEKTGRTGHAKVYGGGDLANGGKEVVNAVAEGKRAAIAIDEAFRNG
jgi:glutamate synthase (NADPH/NADH) small chain